MVNLIRVVHAIILQNLNAVFHGDKSQEDQVLEARRLISDLSSKRSELMSMEEKQMDKLYINQNRRQEKDKNNRKDGDNGDSDSDDESVHRTRRAIVLACDPSIADDPLLENARIHELLEVRLSYLFAIYCGIQILQLLSTEIALIYLMD